MSDVKLWEVFEVWGDPKFDPEDELEIIPNNSKIFQCTEEELQAMIDEHRLELLEAQINKFIKELVYAENRLNKFLAEGGVKKKKKESLERSVALKTSTLNNVRNTKRVRKSFYYKEVVISTNLK